MKSIFRFSHKVVEPGDAAFISWHGINDCFNYIRNIRVTSAIDIGDLFLDAIVERDMGAIVSLMNVIAPEVLPCHIPIAGCEHNGNLRWTFRQHWLHKRWEYCLEGVLSK